MGCLRAIIASIFSGGGYFEFFFIKSKKYVLGVCESTGSKVRLSRSYITLFDFSEILYNKVKSKITKFPDVLQFLFELFRPIGSKVRLFRSYIALFDQSFSKMFYNKVKSKIIKLVLYDF